ncbi:MAG: DUF389 domain-containing protein [Deltaproteobacteria bacterium]|nr:DUF389 domain-containing protein [Deltaproteobacteria bacterium]
MDEFRHTPDAEENKDRYRTGLVSGISAWCKDCFSRGFMDLLSVDDCRKSEVLDDIGIGSTPKATYYLLLSISVLIAGFGVLTNSPAVVIGAMLVSPLMTPIFGISLGLVRGDMVLLRKAFVAEFGGVVIAVGVAAMLGMFPFAQDVTPEMLSRTSPTLLDLMVAALAGVAGCLAMIDERISPVLPGIAMATALTPPLAVSGLCLAFGAYVGAWGAFLLFFANFLAILAVSAVLFIAAGFVSREEMGSGMAVLKRFLAPVIGLILVTVLLTNALIGIIAKNETTKAIKVILDKELSSERGACVENVIYDNKASGVDILAYVTTPRVLSPKKIEQMQNILDKKLDAHAHLIMRCFITKDISSTGSTSGIVARNLDGEFITSKLHPNVKRIQIAEQVLREMLENYRGLYLDLDNLDLVELPNGAVVVASIQSGRTLTPLEVSRFEKAIQKRLGDENVRLLIRSDDLTDVSSKGRVLYGKAHFGELSKEEKIIGETLENETRSEVKRIKNMFAPNVDAVPGKDMWLVRAEVVGPRVIQPAEVRLIEKRLGRSTGKKVDVHVWSRVELVVTGSKYIPVEEFTKEQVSKN